MFLAARVRRITVGLAMASTLTACGGSPAGPTITPTPTVTAPPAPVVVSQGNGLPLEAGFIGRTTFTTSRSGALDVTVDWTYASNDVDVLVAKGDCSFDQLDANQCSMLAFAMSTSAKPEKVHVDSTDAGSYTLFVENTGDTDEAISYQVVLTARTVGSVGIAESGRGPQLQNPLSRKASARGHVELR